VSTFSDYAKAILAGGLPAVLDNNAANRTAQGDTRPERTAPESTIKDMEPFMIGNTPVSPMLIVAGAVALMAVVVTVASFRR
jgi:hypothetical protein